MFSKRIFISTSLRDSALRRAAIDAVWRLNMSPVLEQMDLPSPLSLVERMWQAIDTADGYVGVFDSRSGLIPESRNRSFVEIEYRHARERGIPILVFLRTDSISDEASVTAGSNRFLDEVRMHSMVEYFTDAIDLGRKILRGLSYLSRSWEGLAVANVDLASAERLETSTERIFLSYRRQDTAATCLHLDYRLEERFGEQTVFMDQSSILGGEEWEKHITGAVARSGVVLALIGNKWLTIKDKHGQRRIDDPNDTLHQEIAIALQREIPVIPILVDAAKMPERVTLPEPLWRLCKHQALQLRNTKADFSSDVQRIIEAAKRWINTSALAD